MIFHNVCVYISVCVRARAQGQLWNHLLGFEVQSNKTSKSPESGKQIKLTKAATRISRCCLSIALVSSPTTSCPTYINTISTGECQMSGNGQKKKK